MAGEAAAALQTIMSLLGVLRDFESSFHFGAFLCPFDAPIDTITFNSFDYVIVGGGTAGLVLANRLSACPDVNVLVLEAGYCPPMEAVFPRDIALQSRTKFDYNITAVNDNRTCQNLQGSVASLTQGKMLGGSSSIFHMLVARGGPDDYNPWVKITNDSSWSYNNLLKYFKRSENVRDKAILRQFGPYHGTHGPTIMEKQIRPENKPVLDAYEEIGYKRLLDTSSKGSVLGVVDPLFQIGDKLRQSSLVSYLYPVRHRRNLFILTEATVKKIIIQNKVATGVQFDYKKKSYTVSAKAEVIVSAGAIKTPQLLMLSGIGPADHLKSLNIPVVADLPVGKNLQDHVSGALAFALKNDTSPPPPASPFHFAIPLMLSYKNMKNPNASYATNQCINVYFPQNSPYTMQFCLNLFMFSVPVCQIIYEHNRNRSILLVTPNVLHPKSRGEILLNTTDINDQPLVYMKYLTEYSDLKSLAAFMNNTVALVNTTAFKNIGAELVDFGICTNYPLFSEEYWECAGIQTSCTSWHYCGTASMGYVVDTNLLVKGIRKLRVVDSSVIPFIIGGKINAAVLAVAEKIADVILASNPSCASRVKKCQCKCGC